MPGFIFAAKALFPFKNRVCFVSCLWILDIAWMDSFPADSETDLVGDQNDWLNLDESGWTLTSFSCLVGVFFLLNGSARLRDVLFGRTRHSCQIGGFCFGKHLQVSAIAKKCIHQQGIKTTLCKTGKGETTLVFPKIVVPQNGWFTLKNPIKNERSRGTNIFGNIHMFPQQVVHWPSNEKCLFPRLHNAHSTTGWLILSLDGCVLMNISGRSCEQSQQNPSATCRPFHTMMADSWEPWLQVWSYYQSIKNCVVFSLLRVFTLGRFRFRNSTRKSPNITALCIPFQPAAAPFKYKKDSSIKVWAVLREVPDWMETSFLDIHA